MFLSFSRFCALWSSKPSAFVHLYLDIVSIACRYSWRIWHFLLPMQLFEGSGAFFMQRVYNLKINLILCKNRFCLQDIGFFLLKCQYIKSHMHSGCIFLLAFAMFLNMWSYSYSFLYSYLVWWPPPQELELALGGWPHIYIYIYIHTYIHAFTLSFLPISRKRGHSNLKQIAFEDVPMLRLATCGRYLKFVIVNIIIIVIITSSSSSSPSSSSSSSSSLAIKLEKHHKQHFLYAMTTEEVATRVREAWWQLRIWPLNIIDWVI